MVINYSAPTWQNQNLDTRESESSNLNFYCHMNGMSHMNFCVDRLVDSNTNQVYHWPVSFILCSSLPSSTPRSVTPKPTWKTPTWCGTSGAWGLRVCIRLAAAPHFSLVFVKSFCPFVKCCWFQYIFHVTKLHWKLQLLPLLCKITDQPNQVEGFVETGFKLFKFNIFLVCQDDTTNISGDGKSTFLALVYVYM